MVDEQRWREYVDAYDIEVPEDAVENEMEYISLEMRHRMQYDRLTGGGLHLMPGLELAQQEEDLRAVARFEAKQEIVLKDILAKYDFAVSREELEEEARALAQRQGATMDMVKMFFGEDFRMLERDVRERKAKQWACGQGA